MNVSREEAAKALAEVGRANDRIIELHGYHHGAPFFIIWGLVWMGANITSYFVPEWEKIAWPIGVGIGFVLSTILGVRQSQGWKRGPATPTAQRRFGFRMGMTGLVVMGFIIATLYIARPETGREVNAMVSIIFPFLYMAGGIWAGWRLFAIGLVTAVAIIGGYTFIPEHFELWMGVFGGGSLIAGGIWLRTA